MSKNKMMIASMLSIGFANSAHASITWTGIYAGTGAGFTLNQVQLKSQHLGFADPSNTCNVNSTFSTFSPGIQLGYMHQFSNSFVTGIEVSGNLNTNQEQTLSCSTDLPEVYDRFKFRSQGQADVKVRLGHSLNLGRNSFLPYFTSGVSLNSIGLKYENEGGDFYANSSTKAGWLLGAGIEWAFQHHWSLRAEYDYADYGENALKLEIPSVYELQDPNGNAHVSLNSNNIVASLHYWITN